MDGGPRGEGGRGGKLLWALGSYFCTPDKCFRWGERLLRQRALQVMKFVFVMYGEEYAIYLLGVLGS